MRPQRLPTRWKAKRRSIQTPTRRVTGNRDLVRNRMCIRTIGLAALMAGSLMGGGSHAQQTLEDEIQQEEAPGSAIEAEIFPGRVIVGRQRNLNPSPVEIQGQ